MRLVRRRRRHIRPGFESGICPAQRRGGALDGGNLTLEVLTIGSGEQSRIVGDSRRRHSPDRVACGAFGWDKVRTLVRHDMHLHLPIFPRRQAQGSRYSSLANLNVAIDPHGALVAEGLSIDADINTLMLRAWRDLISAVPVATLGTAL